jgi:hypothetical protein
MPPVRPVGVGPPPGYGVRKKKSGELGYGQGPTTRSGYGKKLPPMPGVPLMPKAGRSIAAEHHHLPQGPIPIQQAALLIPSPFIIQGKHASDLEWRIWRQLLKLGWPESEIDFQVDVLGGHMPGGAALDFVVWTPGMVTIVEPNGDYWHIRNPQVRERDRVRISKIQQAWGRPFRYFSYGSGDIDTDARAYDQLLLDVGRF